LGAEAAPRTCAVGDRCSLDEWPPDEYRPRLCASCWRRGSMPVISSPATTTIFAMRSRGRSPGPREYLQRAAGFPASYNTWRGRSREDRSPSTTSCLPGRRSVCLRGAAGDGGGAPYRRGRRAHDRVISAIQTVRDGTFGANGRPRSRDSWGESRSASGRHRQEGPADRVARSPPRIRSRRSWAGTTSQRTPRRTGAPGRADLEGRASGVHDGAEACQPSRRSAEDLPGQPTRSYIGPSGHEPYLFASGAEERRGKRSATPEGTLFSRSRVLHLAHLAKIPGARRWMLARSGARSRR